MASIGNIGVTSLLSSARSAKNKALAEQDRVVKFNWDSSAKTDNDYAEYQRYLMDRAENTSSSSKRLTLNIALRTANRTFQGAEIQRATIDVLTGKISDRDKYDQILKLYYQASDLGDFNQVQDLTQQLNSLSVKITNEEAALASSAQYAADLANKNNIKSLKESVDLFVHGSVGPDGTPNAFIEIPPTANNPDGSVVQTIDSLNKNFQDTGDGNYFNDLASTTTQMSNYLVSMYNGTNDPDLRNEISKQYDKITKKIPIAGGSTMTLKEIQIQKMAQDANNSLYTIGSELKTVVNEDGTVQDKLVHSLVKNKIDDFIYIRLPDGTIKAQKTTATTLPPDQMLNTKIDDQGKIVLSDNPNYKGHADWTIKERLKAQGIIATSNSDGTLTLVVPGLPSLVQGTIEPDGTVRYFSEPNGFSNGGPGLYEINALTGISRDVSPGEISNFGTTKSAPSALGNSQVASLFNVGVDSGPISSTSHVFQPGDLSPVGRSALLGASLQGGGSNIRAIEQQSLVNQTISGMTNLGSSRLFGLNQTPVAQTRESGIKVVNQRQSNKPLPIAQPKKQPKVVVAKPKKQPKVVVAKPRPKPKVVVKGPKPAKKPSGDTGFRFFNDPGIQNPVQGAVKNLDKNNGRNLGF